MADYANVRVGKLKLKGEKRKKHKKSKREKGDEPPEQITGSVCIEYGLHQYVRALDNGYLILGAPHSAGEGPDQEEIFVAIRSSSNQVAFKTGYNKYLSVDARHRVVGRSDAVGPKEQFDSVFQEGKLAIMASNNCFLSIDEDNEELPYLVAKSHKVADSEICKLRTNINPELTRIERLKKEIPDEEKGSLRDCEVNYVRKYQSFQDKKMRLNSGSDISLKKAHKDGKLHEALLDRRSKMKADKFC
ncbi:Protein frg1 [Tyrophagus putrescentiae]|nr:Protein frg1 [Tyrophagus putrescentiae]